MFLSPVDENEVIGVVESCKNKSSTDAEGMNIDKHIITSIIKPLTHIFSTSFQTYIMAITKNIVFGDTYYYKFLTSCVFPSNNIMCIACCIVLNYNVY